MNNAMLAGPWYHDLYETRTAGTPRRVAIAMDAGLLSPIRDSIAASLGRCGHECVGMEDEPELIIANWWKDRMAALNLLPGVPVVHWWVGSDTHRSTVHAADRDHNWVVTPWLARVIKRRVGVMARVIPLAPSLEPRLLPRSEFRKVLVYCPSERKYGWKHVVEVARACPDIEFLVLLKDGSPELGNMTCLLYTSPSPRDRQRSRMPSSA